MKKYTTALITLLLGVMLVALMPTEVEGAVYTDTVRLHVLASSDTEEDQRIKLAVRDAIITRYGEALKGSSPEEAERAIRELLPEIEKTACETLEREGAAYKAHATLTCEWYDTRAYGDFSMPKGYYTSLVVTLGEGKGQNWWCVMYPPLCLDMAVDQKRDDGALGTLGGGVLEGTGRYLVKFKALELLSSLTKSQKD